MANGLVASDLMMPSLDGVSLSPGRNSRLSHLAADRPLRRYRSGRLAIAAALELAGVGDGDEVLVPAYHCPSMFEPVEAVGAIPVFYRIRDDLQVDRQDLEQKLTDRSRAVLAVHFYGVLADLDALRQLADDRQLTLLEDCAHCFSYGRAAGAFGQLGDYVVTSPRKFIPTYDGGELFAQGGAGRQSGADLRYQLKMLKNTFERRAERGREGPALLAAMDTNLDDLSSRGELDLAGSNWVRPDDGGAASGGYRDPRFDFQYVHARASASGRLIASLLALDDVIERRRQNAALLREQLSGLSGARLLEPGAAQYETPYVVPLYVPAGDAAYGLLRRIGVPMWRWDEIRESDCEVSRDYAERVFQLPCHQGLDEDAMRRIGRVLRQVLG